jgi:hypothetical protein
VAAVDHDAEPASESGVLVELDSSFPAFERDAA